MNNELNENIAVEEDKQGKKGIADGILDWAESFVFAVFVVILIFTFVLRTVVVVGDSMNPNSFTLAYVASDVINPIDGPSGVSIGHMRP